jgi:hypothetical protein
VIVRPQQRRLAQGPVSPHVKNELRAYLDRHAAFVPDGRGLVSVADVALRLQRAMDAGQGLSLVRLGDGEGGCLFGAETDTYPALARHVASACLARHFGPQVWSDDDLRWAHDDIAGAVAASGIVTFARRAERFPALVAGPVQDLRGVVGATWADIWLTRRRPALSAAIYRDGYLHRDLLPFYPQLLRGRRLVLVSSLGQGFANRVAAQFAAADAALVPITGQWSNGDDGPPLYPDGLAQVQARLDALAAPGTVVLVAAGLAAKGLCARAAGQGAVAIDVGSIMDVWAGRAVRPYHADDFVERNRL